MLRLRPKVIHSFKKTLMQKNGFGMADDRVVDDIVHRWMNAACVEADAGNNTNP